MLTSASGSNSSRDRSIRSPPRLIAFSPIVLVDQEILQGSQQKGAESTLFPISAFQCIFLEQMKKKSLHEILCISGSIAAMTQKGIKWRPISFAKSGKRALSRFR